MTQYSKVGEFTRAIFDGINADKSKRVSKHEILRMTVEKAAKQYPEIFQAAWHKIEELSEAPKLNFLALDTTINRIDLYYGGILLSPESHELNKEYLRELMRLKYAALTDTDHTVVETLFVMNCFDKEMPEEAKDWKGPLMVIHDKIDRYFVHTTPPRYTKNEKYLSWVTETTTVGEVFDFIIAEIEDALNKKAIK